LREFVDLRGVEKPPEERVWRRPRTCIFSAETSTSTHAVDLFYYVGNGKVEQVHMKELQELRVLARKWFNGLDVNGDNGIGWEEFYSAIRKSPWFCDILGVNSSINDAMKEDHLKEIFYALDHSGDGAWKWTSSR